MNNPLSCWTGLGVGLRWPTLALIVTLALTACNASGPSDEEMEAELLKVFDGVSMAFLGKYAPGSDEMLRRCQEQNDHFCLDIYDRFMSASQRLRAMDPQRSLALTLKIVQESCLSEQLEQLESLEKDIRCFGGRTTLYRYHTPELDALMLEGIRRFPTELQEEVFKYPYQWLLNRPNPQLWIDFVEQSDMESGTKQWALKRLDVNNPDAKPENRDWRMRVGFDE